jgi:hypothetical protein
MKAYWGSGGIAPHILNLSTKWRWVVSFTPGVRAPGAHFIGWVGPRASLQWQQENIPSLPIYFNFSVQDIIWFYISVTLEITTQKIHKNVESYITEHLVPNF